jgi:tol-pal system protein YbgF
MKDVSLYGLVFSLTLCCSSSWLLAKSGTELRLERLEHALEQQQKAFTNEQELLKRQLQEMRGTLEELVANRAAVTPANAEVTATKASSNAPASGTATEVTATATEVTALKDTPAMVAEVRTTGDLLANEQLAFEQAYQLVEAQKYVAAQGAWQQFIERFPDSKQLPQAHYWLGEIYLHFWHVDGEEAQVERAVAAFQLVVEHYASHHRAADCLFKLGTIALERKQWLLASEHFNKLLQQYPGSSRASLASVRLNSLREQGLIS